MRASISLVLLLLSSTVAHAQTSPPEQTRAERMYLGNNHLMGSTRVVALGGAYTAIGEGVSGFTSNLAALAHRAPHLDRNWDLGFTFSWQDVPLFSTERRDLDNDGARDDSRVSAQYLVGLMLQYERFGIGTYMRSNWQAWCGTIEGCADSELVGIRSQHTALAVAMAIGRDDFILGAGIYAAEVGFTYRGEEWRYGGNGIELDMLYRPLGLPYRIGLSVKPQVVGHYLPRTGQLPFVAGRQLYSAVVSPGVLSLGAAWRFGEGAHNFNRLSPAARREAGVRLGEPSLPPELPRDVPNGRWLVSAQADLIAPAEGTVAMNTFTRFEHDVPVGRTGAVIPRVGVEHETFPGYFRTRLGTFLETSPYPEVSPRPHLTGGAEVYLFHYYDDFALSFSFDLAQRYQHIGLSVGFWR